MYAPPDWCLLWTEFMGLSRIACPFTDEKKIHNRIQMELKQFALPALGNA